jgi:hypothetical protein
MAYRQGRLRDRIYTVETLHRLRDDVRALRAETMEIWQEAGDAIFLAFLDESAAEDDPT